ncbi:MAG: hypothetical protein KA210_05260 [Bacteroidia bacterium]|nr:hypothetical protein [Bacteroidia bacterium]
MIKDIEFPKIKDVKIAIVNEDLSWKVVIINNSANTLENVLVTSKGYGKDENNETITTSTLRHSLGDIKSNENKEIETIISEIFHLTNEYWLSYYCENKIYDKKFIFLPETIKEENLIFIKELNSKGILHD